MFWSEDIPRHVSVDSQGRTTEITSIAGHLPAGQGSVRLCPAAAFMGSHACGRRGHMDDKDGTERAMDTAAAANAATRRNLYFFEGARVTLDGKAITEHAALELRPTQEVQLINGNETSEFLLLQGRPINETVVQSGPFVMNSPQEITQAFADYSRTRFGGWPWPDTAPVHGSDYRRFASMPMGKRKPNLSHTRGSRLPHAFTFSPD